MGRPLLRWRLPARRRSSGTSEAPTAAAATAGGGKQATPPPAASVVASTSGRPFGDAPRAADVFDDDGDDGDVAWEDARDVSGVG